MIEGMANDRALVLSGGGPTGIAWEVGLAAGLAAGGVDVRRADFILGTSAGSVVGGQLAQDIDPQPLAQLHMAFSRELAKQASAEAAPRINHLLAFMRRIPRGTAPTPAMMLEMGTLALQSQTIPETEFVARFAGLFGPTADWPERFACTTVNAHDGRFKLWRRADGVALERAVAASCSVPGVFPPVAIKDSVWIDGGVRSRTNADYAAGYRRVLVVAVVLPDVSEVSGPMLARESAAIEAAQGSVQLITPDPQSCAAFGDDLMAETRGVEITEAGIAQGQREAARLKLFWD
jgi:NTE family protein